MRSPVCDLIRDDGQLALNTACAEFDAVGLHRGNPFFQFQLALQSWNGNVLVISQLILKSSHFGSQTADFRRFGFPLDEHQKKTPHSKAVLPCGVVGRQCGLVAQGMIVVISVTFPSPSRTVKFSGGPLRWP